MYSRPRATYFNDMARTVATSRTVTLGAATRPRKTAKKATQDAAARQRKTQKKTSHDGMLRMSAFMHAMDGYRVSEKAKQRYCTIMQNTAAVVYKSIADHMKSHNSTKMVTSTDVAEAIVVDTELKQMLNISFANEAERKLSVAFLDNAIKTFTARHK